MAKLDFKKSKNVTKTGAPVERTVKWSVTVTESNLEQLTEVAENPDLVVGDTLDLEGQVFIKRMSFKASCDTLKAFDWEINAADVNKSTIKSIDSDQLQATRILGTVCVDNKGTPFFESIQDVYDSDPKFIDAIYLLSDEVNNFMGKSQKSNSEKTNSGANSSSVESEDVQSQKPKKALPSQKQPSGESIGIEGAALTQDVE